MWAEAVNTRTNLQLSLLALTLPTSSYLNPLLLLLLLLLLPPICTAIVVSQMFVRLSRAVDWFMALKSHLGTQNTR